jgi:hypothetical protein
VLVPLVAVLYEDWEGYEGWDWWGGGSSGSNRAEPADHGEPLQTLRDRYARGALTDEQFGRKLGRLLETETIESAEDRERARLHEYE